MKENFSWKHNNQCKKKDDSHLENMKTNAKRRAIIAWKYEDQPKGENGCNLKIRRPTWKGRWVSLKTWKLMQKREQLQFENMKIDTKGRWVATWKQEDQHEKDFLHLENKKTNAKKRIVVPYSLKTQRPIWNKKTTNRQTPSKNNNGEFHKLNVKLL